MSGDAKTKSRKRKQKDQVERFTESRLALQRAMEKDYRTGKQARRSEDGERASAQKTHEKDANAARLAALLDAARRQEETVSAEPGKSAPARNMPPINRALAAPASYVTEDVHAARARATHPDPGDAPVADPVKPPPLVDRDLDGSKMSSGKVVLRLLLVAALFGAAIYAFVTPNSKEDAVSAADTPSIAPDAVPAPASAIDTAATGAPPPVTAEPAVPAEPPAKPIAKPTAEGSAAPVVKTSSPPLPAAGSDPTEAAAEAVHAEKAPAHNAAADTAPPEETATVAKPATPEAAAEGAATRVAVSAPPVRRAVDIPPPPPPPSSPVAKASGDAAPADANTPAKAKPDLTIGEETLRALSLIGPDAASIDGAEPRTVTSDRSSASDNPPVAANPDADSPVSRRTSDTAVASDSVSVKPVSSGQPLVERRSYFQRLGPTPPPNPFHADDLQPPPAPTSSDPYYYDIE